MIIAWSYNELAADLDQQDESLELFLPRPGTASSKHVLRIDKEYIEANAWDGYTLQDTVDETYVGAGASVTATSPLKRGILGSQATRHSKFAPIWARWEMDQLSASVLDDFTAVTTPVANSIVRRAVPDGRGGWYICGDFTDIDTVTVNRCARINANGRRDTAFVAECGSVTYDMELSPDGQYLAIATDGNTYNGATVGSTGALLIVDPETGVLLKSFAATVGGVRSVAWYGEDLFVSGNFTTMGIATNARLQKIEKSGSTWQEDTTWSISANATVEDILIDGDRMYIGGTFTSLPGPPTLLIDRVAAINLLTEEADGFWAPNAGGNVLRLRKIDEYIYICGSFTTLNGVARARIARVDTTYGSIDATFVTEANGDVHDVYNIGDELYVMGAFTELNATATRARFDRVSLTDGTLLSDPSFAPDATVYAMNQSGARVMVAGNFTTDRTAIFDGNYNMSPIGRYEFELEVELAANEKIYNVVWSLEQDGVVTYTSEEVIEFFMRDGKTVVPGPDLSLPNPETSYKITATLVKSTGTVVESVGFGARLSDAIYVIPIGSESGDQYDEASALTLADPSKAGNTYTLAIPTQQDTPVATTDHYFYRLFAVLAGDSTAYKGGNQITIDRAGFSDILVVPYTNLYTAEIDWNDKTASFTLTLTFEDTAGSATVSSTPTHPGSSTSDLNPDQVQIERQVDAGTLTGPQFGRYISDWIPVPAGFSVQYANQGITTFTYRYRIRYRDFRRDGVEDERGPVEMTSDWSNWTSWV